MTVTVQARGSTTSTDTGTTRDLAEFLARLRFEDLPHEVVCRTEDLFFLERVETVLDPAIDGAYPARWIGCVEAETTEGRTLTARVDGSRGDPDNGLTRPEREEKAPLLAAFQGGATPEEMKGIIRRVWALDEQPTISWLLRDA